MPRAGLEPASQSAADFKSAVVTNFTTEAIIIWSGRQDSNLRPPRSKQGRLPTDLHPEIVHLYNNVWWSLPVSNRPPIACKAIALPDELRPRITCYSVSRNDSGGTDLKSV